MKKIIVSFLALAIIIFTGCQKSDSGSTTNNAAIMYVNACAGSANVNVTINGTALAAANDLAFFKSTAYQLILSGTDSFAFSLTASGIPLTSAKEALTADVYYSAYAAGLTTNPSFVFTSDDLTAPAAGDTKVRFINLSADSLNVSCYLGTTKLDSNISYTVCTPYTEISATTANVLLQDPLHPTSLAQLTNQIFNAGGIYTVMLTGTSLGTGTAGLTLTVISNNP